MCRRKRFRRVRLPATNESHGRVASRHTRVLSAGRAASPYARWPQTRSSRIIRFQKSGGLDAMHRQSGVATRATCSMPSTQSCTAMFIGVLLLYEKGRAQYAPRMPVRSFALEARSSTRRARWAVSLEVYSTENAVYSNVQ